MIKALTDKGVKPTQLAVSNEIGLSTRSIKKYWGRMNLQTDKRVNLVEQEGEPA